MLTLENNLLIEFVAESRETLATVESDLLEIEKDGADIDEERLNRVFRAVRTIKGASGFFVLGKIGELSHQMENVLSMIRSRQMVPTPDSIRILLSAIDGLNDLFRDPETSNQADISDLMTKLAKLCVDNKTLIPKKVRIADNHPLLGGGCLCALLVEDDFACRLLLQTFLSRYGECHVAVNGKEAVEAYYSALRAGTRYDLICMDIMMPVMDGREAVRQIRALEEEKGIVSTYGAKIIMTTTVHEVKEVIRCFEELCDAYLMKPIDLEQLLNTMKSCQLIR